MGELPLSDPDGDAAFRFMVHVGTLAHDYGVSSRRIEAFLQRLARALGLDGTFTSTLTSLTFIVWRPGAGGQRIHVVRTSPPGFDMGRLARVSELVDAVGAKEVSLDQAIARLRAIDGEGKRPSIYGPLLVGVAYGAAGVGFAVLMSARWLDVLLAGLASVVVFGLVRLCGRWPPLQPQLELIAGIVVAVVASIAPRMVPGGDPVTMTICGLVVLLPGYSLTLGAGELSAGRVVSGLERFMAGAMTLLKLFVGAVVGVLLVHWLVAADLAPGVQGSSGALAWVFAAVLVLGLAIIFQARASDIPWIVVGGVLAFAGIQLGAPLGYWQGSYAGATLVGLYGNVFARLLRRPSAIVVTPATMVLVPGGSALLGLEAASAEGATAAVEAEWRTLTNVGAIIGGVLTANAILRPRSAL